MRGKDLNGVKIVDLILKYERLRLSGSSGDSIMGKFREAGPDVEAPISEKTIQRTVAGLYNDGILEKDEDGYYSIDKTYFVTRKTLDNSSWKKVLTDLLEKDQLDAYRYVRNYLENGRGYELLDDVELARYSDTIREPMHILTNNQAVIQKINHALAEERMIRVAYKGKEYTVYPVCYVVSRDGTRKYLYSVRRKQLLPPMDLSEIRFLEYLEKAVWDRELYVRQVQAAWDIDVQPCMIRILVRKDKEDSFEVDHIIRDYMGKPIEENGRYAVYEGEVTGINDFKAWLRSHIEVCIVLKPDDLREEFIASLQEKTKRYGG